MAVGNVDLRDLIASLQFLMWILVLPARAEQAQDVAEVVERLWLPKAQREVRRDGR